MMHTAPAAPTTADALVELLAEFAEGIAPSRVVEGDELRLATWGPLMTAVSDAQPVEGDPGAYSVHFYVPTRGTIRRTLRDGADRVFLA